MVVEGALAWLGSAFELVTLARFRKKGGRCSGLGSMTEFNCLCLSPGCSAPDWNVGYNRQLFCITRYLGLTKYAVQR